VEIRANWNAYDELRDQLTARGLPRQAVRYVHEARTDTELARLFAACRAGHVAVLIGSTEKLGVGTFTDRSSGGISLGV
jgi:hypothetical protein